MGIYSLHSIKSKRFATVHLTRPWSEAIGTPELRGSWMIYGPPKNGKTSMAFQLAAELQNYSRVFYNSIEEGLSLSIQKSVERTSPELKNGSFVLGQMEFDEMKAYLGGDRRSPGVIFIDSVQFAEMTFAQYKQLKQVFSNKLFVYISHISGSVPEGTLAQRIWRDSSVVFRVEGFKAFPVSRYGGEMPVVVSEERANNYWGSNN
jgi:predicted AAA+ superfamily ATPase